MNTSSTSGPTAGSSDAQNPASSGDTPTRTQLGHMAHEVHRAKTGDLVGPYILLQLIGEGGFGTVWLAERREPMVQRVAIKIIKQGMDSKAVVARFEQERQALAVMDHPNVAKVFDGGVTERGLPYFVMEYVAGEPITSLCDKHRYTIRQRLELFVSVCDAVQHAHMKGIIHRDIKPSNVLAEMVDGKPLVKVIDFGIAKAMVRHAELTQLTSDGMIIGTPEYMSPEQAVGQMDVDTRADVYALGVMLYELLVGRLPFDPTELRRHGQDEIRRIIREQEPPKPSTRLSTAGAEGSAIARSRHHHSAATLIRELRRELEWIPLKAIRKERERRYESAAAFGDDVNRYLDGHALRAAPESRAYLAKKFVTRNRVTVGATAAVFLTLVLGLSGTLWQKREAERQRDLADLARKSEQERADELTTVVDFQADMIGQIDFHLAGHTLIADLRKRFEGSLVDEQPEASVRADRVRQFNVDLDRINSTDVAMAIVDHTILSRAEESIRQNFALQPTTQAQLQQSLADLYVNVGLPAKATSLQESALATRLRLLGNRDTRTLASISRMGELLTVAGRFKEAELRYRESIDGYRAVLGKQSLEAAAVAVSLTTLLSNQGRLAEAETLTREAIENCNDRAPLALLNNLSTILADQGKLAEAEPIARKALDGYRRAHGNNSLETITALSNLAVLMQDQRKLAEAEPLLREAVTTSRTVLGTQHPRTLISLNNLGSLMRDTDRLADAASLYREALDGFITSRGEEDFMTMAAKINLGGVLQRLGQSKQAEDLLEPIRAPVRARFQNEAAFRYAELVLTLGLARASYEFDQQRYEIAERDLLEAYLLLSKTRGRQHQSTIRCVEGLADLYAHWAAIQPDKGYADKAATWKTESTRPVAK